MNKPEAIDLKVRTGLFLWVFVLNIAAPVLVPHLPGWPMWFASIFYFISGMTPKAAKETFCGGLFGLVAAYVLLIGIEKMAPVFGSTAENPLGGLLPALAVALFIILGVIIIGGAYFPLFLNNAAFGYLTIAAINLEGIKAGFVNYLIMLVIGGGIMVGGCMFIVGTIIKNEMKKGGAAPGAHG
jgi:hypothetical protein